MICMKSCGCCSLKAGCNIVAIFGIVMAIVAVIYSVYDLFNSDSIGLPIGKLHLGIAILAGSVCLFQGLRHNSTSLLMVWLIITWIKLTILIGLMIFYIVLSVQASSTVKELELELHEQNHGDDKEIPELRMIIQTAILIVIVAAALDILLTVVSLMAVSSYHSILRSQLGMQRGTSVSV